MKKKIAILGFGFIGKNLFRSYSTEKYIISILDRKASPIELLGKVNWFQGVFHNNKVVLDAIKDADVVYHLISSTVPADDIDENLEVSANVLDTIRLLKLCVKQNVKKIIFFSSASVYGIQSALPISENAVTDPISTHGIHKLTIEKYIQYYNYKYGLECKIIRLSNPYGFGQNLFGRQGLISICLGKVIAGDETIVMGNGNAIRDFIHIDDVVNACHLISTIVSKEILFNIGSGNGYTLNEVFLELKYFFGDFFKLSYQTVRKNDISASILNINKANSVLGFFPIISLREGLSRTIQSYSEEYPVLISKIRIQSSQKALS